MSQGDLARIMAMRVVALTRELWQIQQELEIVPKLGVVSGLVLDKIMILDRQHRIKEKVGSILTLIYTQIARVVQQSQQGRNGEPADSFVYGDRSNRRDGPPPLSQQGDWRRPESGGVGDEGRDDRRPEWNQQRQTRPQEVPPKQQQRGRQQGPPPSQQRQQQQQQPRKW